MWNCGCFTGWFMLYVVYLACGLPSLCSGSSRQAAVPTTHLCKMRFQIYNLSKREATQFLWCPLPRMSDSRTTLIRRGRREVEAKNSEEVLVQVLYFCSCFTTIHSSVDLTPQFSFLKLRWVGLADQITMFSYPNWDGPKYQISQFSYLKLTWVCSSRSDAAVLQPQTEVGWPKGSDTLDENWSIWSAELTHLSRSDAPVLMPQTDVSWHSRSDSHTFPS